MNDAETVVTNEKLLDEFNTVVTEAEHLLKSLASAGSERAGTLQSNFGESLAVAGERLANLREAAVGRATTAARSTDEYVRGNPWRAIGIAAALAAITGLCGGLLIARR